MKTYTLEDLLPPDVVQARVEVFDPLGQVVHLALVAALDLARLANGEVEVEPDAAIGIVRRQPALAAAAAGRGEADLVVARLGGVEGEAAVRIAPLRDHSVVIVEEFLLRQ